MDNNKDIAAVLEEQSKLRNKIITLIDLDNNRVITREQKKTRIDELESILSVFQENHGYIITRAKKNIPYIMHESGEITIRQIEECVLKLQSDDTVHRQPTASTSGKSTKENANVGKITREDEILIRKLNIKINNFLLSIEELKQDLVEYNMWTKEYVELKNHFLCNQWKTIESLQEDVVLNLNPESDKYDDSIFRNAFREMNQITRAMNAKVFTSSHESRRQSRLPDLKVPVFRGNYLQWLNFKDIFESLIDNRLDLSKIQKMEYLKSFLEGEPLRLISAYTLSGENYDEAFTVLKKRYHNKRKLLTIHMDNMFKSVGKDPTANSLKNFHDAICEGVTAIKSIGIENESWGPMIVHFAISCLDIESRSLFEQKYNDDDDDFPQLAEFLRFLEGRYKTLEIINPLKNANISHQQKTRFNHFKKHYSVKKEAEYQQCLKCNGNHRLSYCAKFLSMAPKSRFDLVKTNNHCLNCLQNHPTKQCTSQPTCKHCKSFHNSLLHFQGENTSFNKQANVGQKKENLSTNEVLGTACVIVRDRHGNRTMVRALIDTGAQKNFITESLAQKLKLPRLPYRSEIIGIGEAKAHMVKHAININIEPCFASDCYIESQALVMGRVLTSPMPEKLINEKIPEEWPALQLADKNFRTPRAVDMILGIGFFTKVLIPGIHRSNSTGLIAINTKIGWLILGETRQALGESYKSVTSVVAISEVRDEITKFWEMEEIPQSKPLSADDQLCEDIYRLTHKRAEDGRYIVELPLKANQIQNADLETTRKRAISRFLSQELKFKKDPNYALEYRNFINEYIELGHMKKVKDSSDGYFLPHHAVIKPGSSTTKLRVVFDASAKSTKDFSLNSMSLAGPRLQDDLAAIILRWRRHKYVITADVEKMYRQILVAPKHRKYQKVFWRNSPNDPLDVYELTTVTYGTTSAPYLAIKSLQQLAIDDGEDYPLAAKATLNDFYVDDILSGADTVKECKVLQNQLQSLLQGGGFKLRKWMTNSRKILEQIKEEDVSKEFLSLRDQESCGTLKTLGLSWNPSEDKFFFETIPCDIDGVRPTKRAFSSDIAKLFDPLGWLSPVTIVAKMLFQQTWTLKLDWNDLLPTEILDQWKSFRQNLNDIKDIKIPRWLATRCSSKIELIGFCDASISAYAAVVYLKSISSKGEVSVSLLTAKTKVAPIKQKLTVAKLELCGAHLLAKLFKYVIQVFKWDNVIITGFCDSTITLAWIEAGPARWNTFVANRVSEINRLVRQCEWRYVSTKDNPADCATRGTTPKQLSSFNLWWAGPSWLQQSSDFWPSMQKIDPKNIPEQRRITALTTNCEALTSEVEESFGKYSSISKLKSVIAFCMRFISNCTSNSKRIGPLTAEELLEAETRIIHQVQHAYYKSEIENLQEGRNIGNVNGILALTPMLDDKGVLRVSGRLQNTALTYNEKHPIILPRQSFVSRLLVLEAHHKTNHGLNSLTEYVVRRKYWIVRCKDLIKNVMFHCITCRRRYPKLISQKMGQLPEQRTTFINAFYNSGVDFAGPFNLKAWKGRCNKSSKAYICVFVCMSVKAVHLELVTELSAEAFLAAYRRFSSRRGPCLHIYSDCGTNFIGANNILQEDLKKFQKQWSEKIENLAIQGVQWHFNPPAMPHAGGLWEAAVKSTKGLLFKHLGTTLLTYEEFLTILVQIEGSLNSRPLGRLTDSPEDQLILTPNHFLNGTSIYTYPEPDASDISLASRWKYLQVLKHQFFSDFKKLILQSYQVSQKWRKTQQNIKTNDVVIVEDNSLPPYMWPIGIITDVHPGKDNLVRVVSVKMPTGNILKRPVNKISPLPVLESQNQSIQSKKIKSISVKKPLADKFKNSKENFSQSTRPHNYNLRKRNNKISSICLLANFLLLLLLPSSSSSPTSIVNQQLYKNSGLFFSKLGDVRMSSNSWTMIMYYNMTIFLNELSNLKESSKLFLEKCEGYEEIRSFCNASYLDINSRLEQIIEDNEMLMDMNHSVDEHVTNARKRRAATSLLPFVGTLSRALFGTLDEDYARNIESTIATMQNDDQQLLKLLKNHTSIMETFLQQMKLSENRTREQFKWVSDNLKVIANQIYKNHHQNLMIIRLQFIANHIMSRSYQLFSIQSAIIHAITNAHDGNFRSILPPSMFKEQLRLIKNSLTSEISTPITTNNLIKLYSLLNVRTRVNERMIIFHITLPLTSSNLYELYKPIPIPFSRGGKLLLIIPTAEYFVVSLHGEKYFDMSSTEFAECDSLDSETLMCHQHRPEYKNLLGAQSCEMKLFATQDVDLTLCKVISTTASQIWIQLPNLRDWLYFTATTERINAVCGREVTSLKLQGLGIITINDQCALEHRTFTIPRSGNLGQHKFDGKRQFPEVNISLTETIEPVSLIENKESIMIKQSDNLKLIEQSLDAVKVEQHLSSKPFIQYLPIGNLTTILLLIALAAVAYCLKRCRAPRRPTPAVKAHSSNANTDCKLVEVHPLDRLPFV